LRTGLATKEFNFGTNETMSVKPRCPTCKREMMLVGVEPFGRSRPQHERRQYECSARDLRESHVGEHAAVRAMLSGN
jgi:hypothetical protein